MQLAFFPSEGDFYVSAGSVLITDRGAEALMRQDRNTSKNAISRGDWDMEWGTWVKGVTGFALTGKLFLQLTAPIEPACWTLHLAWSVLPSFSCRCLPAAPLQSHLTSPPKLISEPMMDGARTTRWHYVYQLREVQSKLFKQTQRPWNLANQ